MAASCRRTTASSRHTSAVTTRWEKHKALKRKQTEFQMDLNECSCRVGEVIICCCDILRAEVEKVRLAV